MTAARGRLAERGALKSKFSVGEVASTLAYARRTVATEMRAPPAFARR